MSLHNAHHRRSGRALGLPLAGAVLVLLTLTASGTEIASRGPADGILPGPLAATVLRVVDGDTLDVRVHIWIGQTVETMVRLDGIDTPELRGRCEQEKALAERARARVEALAPAGSAVTLHDVALGKFAGRVVARVRSGAGDDIGTLLVQDGLARPYDGGRRAPWCPTS